MDFFEAQARAKKRTTRLVLLFVLAVLGTIGAGYAATVLIFRQVSPRVEGFGRGYQQYQRSAHWPDHGTTTVWWDPQLFAIVAGATVATVGIASLVQWSRYARGGSAVAESVGGRPVDPQTADANERQLLNVVEEMAIASGTPVPAVYLLDDEPGINAFAAGLTSSDAVVAVTRGAVDKLTRDELQGVIGHEFSHILNGDMRLNLRIAAVVFGILVLGLLGRGILGSLRAPRTRGRRGKGAGAVILVGAALLIIGYVGYFFGRLIQAAVSRQREFLADASAVQFTRNPHGLTGALKKIGGYALGSKLQSSKSTELGHFFFAQAFRSGLTGWWSTHPPIEVRLRALDPSFDGRMFEPPQVVDITRESFQTAGFQGKSRLPPAAAAARAFAAQPDLPPALPPLRRIPFPAARIVSTVGALAPGAIVAAQGALAQMPAILRDAAHAPADAPALVFALLLAAEPRLHERQLALVSAHAGATAAAATDALAPHVGGLAPTAKLPLLQLALPTLRRMPGPALEGFLDTLDELVHADAQVSAFEFALQKMLAHSLELGRHPAQTRIAYHRFNDVAHEIAVVLSVLARAAARDEASATRAFAGGLAGLPDAAGLPLLAAGEAELAHLDAALDKLASASLPIKRRLLLAAAGVVGADGNVELTEAELVRAIAAGLDCPMPPFAT